MVFRQFRKKIGYLFLGGFSLIFMYACSQDVGADKGNVISTENNILINSILFNGAVADVGDLFPNNLSVIQVNFDCPIDFASISAETFSLVNKRTQGQVPFRISLTRGDSAVLLSITALDSIQIGESYTMTIKKTIASKDKRKLAMKSDFVKDYSAPPLNDLSFKVFILNETDTPLIEATTSGEYKYTVPNKYDITNVKLRFVIGRNSTFWLDNRELNVQNQNYLDFFDFSQDSIKIFTQISQAKTTQKSYIIKIIHTPPFQVTSGNFSNQGPIPLTHADRSVPTDPPAISPSLAWMYNPYFKTGSYVILCWNENTPLLPGSEVDWFLVNIPGTYGGLGENAIPPSAEDAVLSYRGFKRPPSGQTYTVHYSVFAIKESRVSIDNVDKDKLKNAFFDYAKKSFYKDANLVPIDGFTIGAVADIVGTCTVQ